MFKHPWILKNVKSSWTEKLSTGLFILCGMFWGIVAGIQCFGNDGWHNTRLLTFVAPFGVMTMFALGNIIFTNGKTGKQKLVIAITNISIIVIWLTVLNYLK